jgi:O-methyltransferase involved in polyketide biosynthesis
MAERKRAALGETSAGHRVVDLDALADTGSRSLAAVAAGLDPGKGTAIITEGLLSYFPRDAVNGTWRRFAAALHGFPRGVYLTDLHLNADSHALTARAFKAALAVFVRGRVHVHFDDEIEVQAALINSGFGHATLEPAGTDSPGARLVHIAEAVIGP